MIFKVKERKLTPSLHIYDHFQYEINNLKEKKIFFFLNYSLDFFIHNSKNK
jgi:hypothetical protein